MKILDLLSCIPVFEKIRIVDKVSGIGIYTGVNHYKLWKLEDYEVFGVRSEVVEGASRIVIMVYILDEGD